MSALIVGHYLMTFNNAQQWIALADFQTTPFIRDVITFHTLDQACRCCQDGVTTEHLCDECASILQAAQQEDEARWGSNNTPQPFERERFGGA